MFLDLSLDERVEIWSVWEERCPEGNHVCAVESLCRSRSLFGPLFLDPRIWFNEVFQCLWFSDRPTLAYTHMDIVRLRSKFQEIRPNLWLDVVRSLGNRCLACNADATVLDHVIPLTQGGLNWVENLQPFCNSCNATKGSSIPILGTYAYVLNNLGDVVFRDM
jgi:hypothetical protein